MPSLLLPVTIDTAVGFANISTIGLVVLFTIRVDRG